MEFETTFIATDLGVVAYDDEQGVRWPVEKDLNYMTEDGVIVWEADGDCTLCDNWGCKVCA